jgi:hypothetical protein
MIPMMMMVGGGKDMFDGMMDFGMDDDDGEGLPFEDDDEEEDESPKGRKSK